MRDIRWETILRVRPELAARPAEKEFWLAYYESQPEALFADRSSPVSEQRQWSIKEQDQAPESAATPDAGAHFAGEPEVPEDGDGSVAGSLSEAILYVALDSFVTDIVLERRTGKQSMVLQTLLRLLQSGSGDHLLAVVDHHMEINASALTEAINQLPAEERGGKTVSVPTVQAAMNELLEHIRDFGFAGGRLRGMRGIKKPR